MRFNFLLFIVFISGSAFAQRGSTQEMMRDMELGRRADIMRVLDSAVILMNKEQYVEAEKRMVFVLNNIGAIPSDLCYYFGKNSFYLGKYKQSADWLNKYIQLKGTGGQYYAETIKLIEESERQILLSMDTQPVENKSIEVLSRGFDIDCGASGKAICPVCKGTTVIIKKGLMGSDEYKSCTYCDKHGFLTCEDFNRLLRGELNSKN